MKRSRPNPCGHVNPTAVLCHVCGPRNFALFTLMRRLRERLDHSLSAGVENWPEYAELKEVTR